MKKIIIHSLLLPIALVVSSYALAISEVDFNRLQQDYNNKKASYLANPITNATTARNQLESIRSQIGQTIGNGINSRWRDRRNNWVDTELGNFEDAFSAATAARRPAVTPTPAAGRTPAGLPAPQGGGAVAPAPAPAAGGQRGGAGAAQPAGLPAPDLEVRVIPSTLPAQGQIAGSNRLQTQNDQIDKFIDTFNNGVENADIIIMQKIYQDFQKAMPNLDLISEKDKDDIAEQMRQSLRGVALRNAIKEFNEAYTTRNVAQIKQAYEKALSMSAQGVHQALIKQYNQMQEQYLQIGKVEDAIKSLFEYIAKRDAPTARRAESALIRILNAAPKDPNIRQQQDELIGYASNGKLETAYGVLISPRMMTRDDKPRTAPITADDTTIKAF
jgi:hypothetical protein